MGKVPDDEEVRAVCQIKNNLAPVGNTMAFSLGEKGFRWIGKYDISEDELLSVFSNGNKREKIEKAENLLKNLLEQHDVIRQIIWSRFRQFIWMCSQVQIAYWSG